MSDHVLHVLYEPRLSGIGRHVLEVVRALPEWRHTVVFPAQLAGLAEELEEAGARPEPLRLSSRVLPPAALIRLPWLLRRRAPDLVHLHALEAGLFGSLAGALGGARAVVFGPQTLESRQRLLLGLYWRALRAMARRHAVWLGASAGHARALRARAPRGVRVHLVPNAPPRLGPLPAPDAARARLGWPAEGPAVAAVVRLCAQKDPLTFVRAARRNPGVFHALIGDGPLRRAVEREARGLANLRLHGALAELEPVYAGSDVIAQATRWEGMSLVLLSALAAGRAAIASRVDGNTDLVRDGETGLLVAPGDALGLAAAAARLASDPALRARLGAAGRRLVAAEYSAARAADALRAAYADALAGPQPRLASDRDPG
ncbi:MAG: glycosyltransferase [Planctomycetota bacterium]